MDLCVRWLRCFLLVSILGGSCTFADGRAFEIICLPTISKMPAEYRCPVSCNKIYVLIEAELSSQKNVNLVSRQFIDAILNEKTMELKGLSRQQQQEWNKFKASGAILCSCLFLDEKSEEAILMMELISAQNGQCIIESKIELRKKNPSVWSKQIENAVSQLCNSLPAASQRLCSSMLIEATVTADVGMKHAYWRSKHLAENMDAALAKLKYVTLLKPRQPQATLEERILRVMGLTDADQSGHDKLVYLKPTPTGRLDVKFAEHAKEGQAIDDFKLSAEVVMKTNSHVVFSQKVEGTIGQFEKFQKKVCLSAIKACEVLAKKQGITIKAPTTLPAVAPDAKKQARAEMNAIKKWTSLVEKYGDSPQLSKKQKLEMANRALRAWNLDPTYEYAAYIACMMYRYNYPTDRYDEKACNVMGELFDKYLKCFDEQNPIHFQILMTLRFDYYFSSIPKSECFNFQKKLQVSELKYPNRSIVANFRYRFFLLSLAKYIMTIDDKRLHEEYKKWKKFFFEEYQPLWQSAYKSHNRIEKLYFSWELVEATYYARLKQPEKVKEAFQRAADNYSIEQKEAWGSRGLVSDYLVIVRKTLAKAGVKNPNEWKPVFHHSQLPDVKKQLEFVKKLREFSLRMNKFPDKTDISKYQPMPLNLPYSIEHVPLVKYSSDSIKQNYSKYKYSVQPIGVINKKWWLYVSPVLYYSSDRYTSSCLAIGKNLDYPELNSMGSLSELPWPKYPAPENKIAENSCDKSTYFHIKSYYIEKGKNSDEFTLWVGTYRHGLAKIVYRDGKISGRWFTTHDGLPSKVAISDIFPTKYKNVKGLLLSVGYDYHQFGRRKVALFFLDTRKDKIRLIKDELQPFALLKFADNSMVVLPDSHRYGISHFSSNQCMCSWADAIKTQLNSLAKDGIDNVKVSSYRSYPPVFAFARDYNNKGYIYIDGNDMGWMNGRYQKLKTINLMEMQHSRDYKHLGLYMSGKPCAFIGSVTYVVNCGDIVAMAAGYKPEGSGPRECKHLFYLWQPGKIEPFIEDKWYGPFNIDDNIQLASIFPGDSGYVWLIDRKTGNRYIRVDVKSAIKLAKSKGYVFTTGQEMRKFFQTLTASDWRMNAKGLASNGQVNEAHGLLDDIIKENSDKRNIDYFDALILKAAIYISNSRSYDKAISIHRKILAETESPEYQFLARKSAGIICFEAKDYIQAEKFLSKVRKFPEVREMWKEKGFMFHLYAETENNYWLNKARKKKKEQQLRQKTKQRQSNE